MYHDGGSDEDDLAISFGSLSELLKDDNCEYIERMVVTGKDYDILYRKVQSICRGS